MHCLKRRISDACYRHSSSMPKRWAIAPESDAVVEMGGAGLGSATSLTRGHDARTAASPRKGVGKGPLKPAS
jgi:hypothetical protein